MNGIMLKDDEALKRGEIFLYFLSSHISLRNHNHQFPRKIALISFTTSLSLIISYLSRSKNDIGIN